ncbi:hypothetical protein MIND_00604500 [Mycena indigotica]|uniref:Tetraspanin n=1 Tax=Mycena indigotica TaxID=2126181 RepID=A0A8H6W311_9AGAR|nr:uncharacterized protein MIND_00604500 [Mycena indigotica]KAF7303749.1 hypothetical protein MIND_00604500 [Mycena indigotica]
MAYVRTRHFCCCLPVRLGVFLLSLGIALLGGAVSVLAWMEVTKLHENPLPKNDEISLYIHAVMFSVLCIVGAFGFFGALTKQRGLVSVFGTMLALHLGFSIATGIYTLYTLFKRSNQAALIVCINNSVDPTDPAAAVRCQNGFKYLKIVSIVSYCLSWLIELYAVLVVTSYVKQLKEEEEANVMHPSASASMSSYYQPNATYAPPATQPNAYPFNQPSQAYGHQA